MRAYRARKKAERNPPPAAAAAFPTDPARALSEWSRDHLKIPLVIRTRVNRLSSPTSLSTLSVTCF